MKLKELGAKLSTKKAEIATSATAMVTAALSSPVFAAEGTPAEGTPTGLTSALTNGLGHAVTDFTEMVAAVLPIGLAVFTATFAVKKGMKFFKNISNS